MKQHIAYFKPEKWSGPRPAWTYRHARRPKRLRNLELKALRLSLGSETRKQYDRMEAEFGLFAPDAHRVEARKAA